VPSPVGGSFFSRLKRGPAISSDCSRVGEIGEPGPSPGLGDSAPTRREVRRRSRDGENVNDLGEVRDGRRGEVGGPNGGVPGVEGVLVPGTEGNSGPRSAGSMSGDRATDASGTIGVKGSIGLLRCVTCLQNKAI
jgi:hypothetical protein